MKVPQCANTDGTHHVYTSIVAATVCKRNHSCTYLYLQRIAANGSDATISDFMLPLPRIGQGAYRRRDGCGKPDLAHPFPSVEFLCLTFFTGTREGSWFICSSMAVIIVATH